ncbi:MAG: outer membrane beta-barrel protein [Sphingobacteriales bacterium]|nr:outer membrane beta-barrel protein [Sphingobacteriales bacterium]
MRRVVFLILSVLIIGGVKGQSFSGTIFTGVSNYQGELQENPYTFEQSHLAGGFGLNYEITEHFIGRANFSFGKVSGDDKTSKKIDRQKRNLNFTSTIIDFSAGVQYDLFSLYKYLFTPYVYVGVSVYGFNPYTSSPSGPRVYLQPLGTEGQGVIGGTKKYELTQLSIPFGGGVKFAVNENISIGIEVIMHKLFTDYLDDVSTTYANKADLDYYNGPTAVEYSYRGDELPGAGGTYPSQGDVRGKPSTKDWFYFTALTASFRLTPSKNHLYDASKYKFDCPSPVN